MFKRVSVAVLVTCLLLTLVATVATADEPTNGAQSTQAPTTAPAPSKPGVVNYEWITYPTGSPGIYAPRPAPGQAPRQPMYVAPPARPIQPARVAPSAPVNAPARQGARVAVEVNVNGHHDDDDDLDDGHKHKKDKSAADVDIESLKATLVEGDHGPALEIYYKVEIEDFFNDDVFDLVITIREGDRVLRDEQSRVIRPIIELANPYDVDDDEMKFKQTILVPLPVGSFQHPSLMTVTASVYLRNSRACLDRSEKYIKY